MKYRSPSAVALFAHEHLPREAALSGSSMETLPMAIKIVLLGRPGWTTRRCCYSGADEESHHPLPTTTAVSSGWWLRTSDLTVHSTPERNAAVTRLASSWSNASRHGMNWQ